MRALLLSLTLAIAAVASAAQADVRSVMGQWRLEGPNGYILMTLRPGHASYEGRVGDETSSSSQAMRYEDQPDGSVRMTEIRSNGGDGEAAVAVQPTADTLVVRRQGGQVMTFRRAGSGGTQPGGK